MNDSVVRRTNAATPPPKFLMVGVEVDAGVRLYASRHMPEGLSFGQKQVNYETLWHVEGALSNMLIITKPTWNEALAELFMIWSNQDANERGLPGQKPSPWKPIGGGTALGPPGSAFVWVVDGQLFGDDGGEWPGDPSAEDQPYKHEPALHATRSAQPGQPPGKIPPRTSPPGKDWPWPHDQHECTDACPPEVRKIANPDPPYEYLKTTPRAELRIGSGWSVQPGPDDQGEAEFVAGVFRDQRAGICGACGATWRIPEGDKLPEHTKGRRDLGIRCEGSGELPVALGLIGSGRSVVVKASAGREPVLYTIEAPQGLGPVSELTSLKRQMKEAGLVVETFGQTTRIRLPVDSAMQYDLRKLSEKAHEIWEATFPVNRPADSTGEPRLQAWKKDERG